MTIVGAPYHKTRATGNPGDLDSLKPRTTHGVPPRADRLAAPQAATLEALNPLTLAGWGGTPQGAQIPRMCVYQCLPTSKG